MWFNVVHHLPAQQAHHGSKKAQRHLSNPQVARPHSMRLNNVFLSVPMLFSMLARQGIIRRSPSCRQFLIVRAWAGLVAHILFSYAPTVAGWP
jgi:hypothetical protein